jgi:hypothetical protein
MVCTLSRDAALTGCRAQPESVTRPTLLWVQLYTPALRRITACGRIGMSEKADTIGR